MPWWEDEVPVREQIKIDPVRLTFDPENPRFTPEKNPSGTSEAAVIKHMVKTADVAELVDSISASGYIDIEPLIVLGEDENLFVLEGNRRLAALRLLSDPDLAEDAKVALPEMAESKKESVTSVSIYRVPRREDARDLIGFKHINGPQAWDALAKARFAAKWLDAEKERETEGAEDALTLADITQRMGDKHATIYRIVAASYVLDQAESAEIFRANDKYKKSFSFSHLYTALSYNEVRGFVGMAPATEVLEPTRNPVPEDRLENLQQLLHWLYGSASSGIEPVIRTQAKDLGRLRKVIGNAKALPMLIATGDLDAAVAEGTPGTVRLKEHLLIAKTNLEKAQSVLQDFDGSDNSVVEVAGDVNKSAAFIFRNAKAASDDYGQSD